MVAQRKRLCAFPRLFVNLQIQVIQSLLIDEGFIFSVSRSYSIVLLLTQLETEAIVASLRHLIRAVHVSLLRRPIIHTIGNDIPSAVSVCQLSTPEGRGCRQGHEERCQLPQGVLDKRCFIEIFQLIRGLQTARSHAKHHGIHR